MYAFANVHVWAKKTPIDQTVCLCISNISL
jgi:hypothetical protein